MPERFFQSELDVLVRRVVQHFEGDFDGVWRAEEAAGTHGFQANSHVFVIRLSFDEFECSVDAITF